MLKKIFITLIVVLTGATLVFSQTQTPPEGGQPRDFQLPAKNTFTLDNGLKVTFVQYGTLPKVNARLVVRTGNIDEAANQVWLADLTGDYLKEGTEQRSARDIAEQAASMGGSVDVSTGLDQMSVSGEALSEFAPNLLTLMADILRHPAFPESELDRLKNNLLRNLSVSKTRPGNLANEKFSSVLFGDHPYGRVFPTEEMIRSFDVDAVQTFYESNFGARRTHLYVVGVFDEAELEKTVRKQLDGWRSGPEATQNIPRMQSEKAVYLIDRPGAPQSTINMGLPVIDPSNKDYVALQVTNTLLGGFFSSRITANIREDKGYTYSPRSLVRSNYRVAYWAQQADVTTAVTGASLKEIFYEIDRLRKEAPPAEELKGIQNYLAGIFVLRNSSPAGIIGQLSFVDLHGLSDDYLSSYVKHIFQVTPQEVQRIMQQYIVPEKMTIVVVGDEKQIRKQVSPYGKVVM